MNTSTTTEIDKSVTSPLPDEYGSISIRVIVLSGAIQTKSTNEDSIPLDIDDDEILPETNTKKPTQSFLEKPSGNQCCVFLINGQKQHAWDNHFITRDLEFKYLRNKMIVIVDCDHIKPEAISRMMQGSRHGFFKGHVYDALTSRLISVLKGDQDLKRLEEEAEEEIANLQSGDEVVKSALDQLIDSHNEHEGHLSEGEQQSGNQTTKNSTIGQSNNNENVVKFANSDVGEDANGPYLKMSPDLLTIRLKPNIPKEFSVLPFPDSSLAQLKDMSVSFDPPISELQVIRNKNLNGENLTFTFNETDDTDDDEYPIDTSFLCTAIFENESEKRILDRRVVINKKKTPGKPKKPIALKDTPTFLKVTSRQPINLILDGPDTHVKFKWDGKDSLMSGENPKWKFQVSSDSETPLPVIATAPVNGKFELLIQSIKNVNIGDEFNFNAEVTNDTLTISNSFLVKVIEKPSPRKINFKAPDGSQRKAPYKLVYIEKENWDEENLECFGQSWSGEYPGSYELPSSKSPITIIINIDMDLLVNYKDSLIEKKLVETTIEQRLNKYKSHVAYHLYQMCMNEITNDKDDDEDNKKVQSDEQKREEIKRVSHTLINLMQVSS